MKTAFCESISNAIALLESAGFQEANLNVNKALEKVREAEKEIRDAKANLYRQIKTSEDADGNKM